MPIIKDLCINEVKMVSGSGKHKHNHEHKHKDKHEPKLPTNTTNGNKKVGFNVQGQFPVGNGNVHAEIGGSYCGGKPQHTFVVGYTGKF